MRGGILAYGPIARTAQRIDALVIQTFPYQHHSRARKKRRITITTEVTDDMFHAKVLTADRHITGGNKHITD